MTPFQADPTPGTGAGAVNKVYQGLIRAPIRPNRGYEGPIGGLIERNRAVLGLDRALIVPY